MIEMGKKYQTRDGRAVRILCVDGPDEKWPVLGIISGNRGVDFWDVDGRFSVGNYHADLVPVPTKHQGWGIIIKSGSESVDIAGQINVWLTSSREDTEYKIRHQPEKNWRLAHVTWED